MKYCSQCGVSNADDAKFCESCGSVWGDAGAAPVPAPASGRGNAKTLIVLAVAAVMLIGALAVGWTLFFKPMSASDYEDKVSDSVVAVTDAFTKALEAFEDDALSEVDFDEAIGDENLAMLRDSVAEGIDGVKAARSELKGLRPPGEYTSVHERLVSGYDSLLGYLVVFDEILGEMTAEDSKDTFSEKSADRFDESTAKDYQEAWTDMGEALEDMGLDDTLDF